MPDRPARILLVDDEQPIQTLLSFPLQRDGYEVVQASDGREALARFDEQPFDLAAIVCPVLLVWGRQDRMVPHSGARIVLDALPATRVELIEGCGHCPQLEATAELLELLLAFPA